MSGDHWIGLVSIDAKVLDGFVEDAALDFAIHKEFVQRGQRNEARVDFEEVAKSATALAAAEPIGAE